MKKILAVCVLLPLAFAACGKDKDSSGGSGASAGVLPGDLDGQLVVKVAAGEAAAVTWLLGQGASPQTRDRNGLPVIFIAAKKGHPGIIGSLMAEGVDVNSSVAAGKGGTMDGTVLGYAAFYGKIEAMAMLKDSGADVNGVGPGGTTPLMMAARGGRADSVRWLLGNGAYRGRKKALETARKVKNPAGRYRETITLLAGRQ